MIARSVAAAVVAGRVTTTVAHQPQGANMKANYPAAAEIERIDAVRGELVKQIEALDAERRAWAEVARKGVRLVEHITVTQSTDGQWEKIAEFYEAFDTLIDAAGIDDATPLSPEAFSIASQARTRTTTAAHRAASERRAYRRANDAESEAEFTTIDSTDDGGNQPGVLR